MMLLKSLVLLILIPLLVLAPTTTAALACMCEHIETNTTAAAQDGKEQGKEDGSGNVRDSIDACSKYSGIYSGAGKYNDSRPAATQCHNAYNQAFKQACLAHPDFMKKDTDPYPEYPTCYDYFHPDTS